MMNRYWFPQKTRGYGAGVPYDWRGWALIAGYLGATYLALLPGAYAARLLVPGVIAIAALTAVFVKFVASKTEGGFTWRWDR